MDDREILKTELMKLLDDIPLERLKALYIKALVASSAKVVNPDCRQGTEPREEIIAWIVERLEKMPLHGVQLRHGVGYRRTRSENHAPASGEFVHVPALGKHIAGLLGIRSGKASHILHFRIEEQVLVGMCLIHEQSVNAQFLKRSLDFQKISDRQRACSSFLRNPAQRTSYRTVCIP